MHLPTSCSVQKNDREINSRLPLHLRLQLPDRVAQFGGAFEVEVFGGFEYFGAELGDAKWRL